MRTVYSKSELIKVIKAGEKRILCKANAAKMLRKFDNRKKVAKTASLLVGLACLAAIPFSGGRSALTCAKVLSLTAGPVTISTAEFAILVGGSVAIAIVLKGMSMRCRYYSDGSVEVSIS